MVHIQRNKKVLAERPLKTSPATGASLATMGFANSLPLIHGSQGCGAFAKVYLIQHFREPFPIQNTAVDQISAVMGSDSNIQDALSLLCNKHQPDLITLLSTGLTEMQGCDLSRNLSEFSKQTHFATQVASVSCPDFTGTLQTGFASTLLAILKSVLSNVAEKPKRHDQVTLLCGSSLTPADVELLKDYCEAFDLQTIVAPDLSLSLDGHLGAENFSPTSTGGTTLEALAEIPASAATLCVGESIFKSGHWLNENANQNVHYFSHVSGLEATDDFLETLSEISGRELPPSLLRARTRLQDTLLDTHFVLSGEAIGIAQETDAALGYVSIASEVGCRVSAVVTASSSQTLSQMPVEHMIIGDHSDLDPFLNELSLVFGNTHCAEFIEPTTPVLRAGFPCHDRFGTADFLSVGYQGARALLHNMANLINAQAATHVQPYVSPYSTSMATEQAKKEVADNETEACT